MDFADYIDPDDLHSNAPDQLCFIYTINHQLFANSESTHDQIIEGYSDLLKIWNTIMGEVELSGDDIDPWVVFQDNYGLLGRSGHQDGEFIVSFWNEEPDLYDKLLYPCLNDLDNQGYIPDEPVHIHTPFDINVIQGHAGTRRPNDTKKELGPEQKEELRLRRQLHLMKGAEKKAAMKKLGLTTQGQKHPWQKGAEDAGATLPGHKWWASQSEDITKFADMIAEV